jgi:hypothetical protein
MTYETTKAFHELLDLIGDVDTTFLEGDRAVPDEVSVVEGYQWLTQILRVALECYLWSDAERPTMVEITSPTLKWGGDNADAFYWYAPVEAGRRYRVTGRRGDSAYLSLTVYGGPDDGRWSDRIVETVNDRTIPFAADGSFMVELGPMDADANAVVLRDYLVEPTSQHRTMVAIECLDDAPPPRRTDAEVAQRFRRAANFLRDLLAIFPLARDPEPNTVQPPYAQPAITYGWAAGDAAYALGSYELDDGEALVIQGRSPECAFWNLCLWNQFLQTYDYRYENVTINGGQCVYEADGSWRIVVAHEDPGVPNWLSTAGHREGRLWFRWFLAESLPEQPTTTVVKLTDLSANSGQ